MYISGSEGKKVILKFGVPQGSLLGPLLFILYCKEIENIASKYGLQVHVYTDDYQFYAELSVSNILKYETTLNYVFRKFIIG